MWALTLENLNFVVCEQQRHKPACASSQTDQHLFDHIFKHQPIKLIS